MAGRSCAGCGSDESAVGGAQVLQCEGGAGAAPRAEEPSVVIDRAADLVLIRDRLIEAMDQVEAKDLPRITKELRAVDVELAALGPSKSPGQSLKDELKDRRARRQSAT